VKKNILVLTGVFLIAVVSCEIPQSITIKGKPGVYIPLGSPFASMDDEDRLENHVSSVKIKEMMGNTGTKGVEVYDYTGNESDPDVQAYIVHYPIAEINLNTLQYDAQGVPVNSDLIPAGQFYLLEGQYPIKQTLRNFLGSNVRFKEAGGYIFVNGIGDASTMTLSFTNLENIIAKPLIANATLKSLNRLEFPPSDDKPFDKPVLPHSLGNNNPMNMIEILNAQSDSNLKYQINIPAEEIKKIDKTIYVDLLILLPLEFEADPKNPSDKYVKLEMGNALLQTGNGDMFGRTSLNSDDNLFSDIEMVRITLKKVQNNTIDGISILVNDEKLLEFETDKSIEFNKENDINDLAFPFNPSFEIVLEKDSKGKGQLKILRPEPGESPIFDFSLTVEARVNINQTMEL